MFDSLINKGVVSLEGRGGSSDNRLVVVGCARGGTSMVAGALHHLGVFMGRRAVAPVFEDVALAELFEAQEEGTAIDQLVADYDRRAAVWGWKRPSTVNYLPRVDEHFVRPLYVFVFKDLLSIANRNTLSMSSEVLPGMRRALEEYRNALDFIDRYQPRSLLVSYDKVMSYPGEFVDALIHFAGLTVDQQVRQKTVDFIRPNPSDYLDMSREGKSVGCVDFCDRKAVRGWARYLYNKRVAPVEVYVNDVLQGVALSENPRADLLKKFDQNCAFQFLFGQPISAGDKVRVKVKDEIYDLRSSPVSVS